MKVRITKASLPSYWYAGKIGQEFEVEHENEHNYALISDSDYIIGKQDCEIIVEPTDQPKWEDRTRGGYEYKIYEEFADKIWGRVFSDGFWSMVWWDLKGIHNTSKSTDLIPFNPRKSELLAEKEEHLKRVAEIDKELNN